MNLRRLSVAFPILPLFLAVPLLAAEFRTGDSLTLSEPVPGGLYMAGGRVEVRAPVAGDLTAAGGSLRVQDRIGGDLQLAGGTVNLDGAVGDDLRVFGGQLILAGTVGGDAIMSGMDLTLNGQIGGDLVAGGGIVLVNATVGGRAKIAGGEVDLNGPVTGALEVQGENVRIKGRIGGDAIISARTLEIDPGASFAGKVRYWSENEPDFGQARAERDETLRPTEDGFATEAGEGAGASDFAVGLGFLFWTVAAGALTIGALLFFLPGFAAWGAERLPARFSSLVGSGAIYLLISPVGIFLLFVSLIGIPLALLWLTVFLLSMLFAKIVAAPVLAAWLLGRSGRQAAGWPLFGASVAVLILMGLVGMIPFVGFLVGIFWLILAAGLVIEKIRQMRQAS